MSKNNHSTVPVKLGVMVPNYNHGRYLVRHLTAILEQPEGPDEILLVDDCSTDDSVKVVEKFLGDADGGLRKNRVRLHRNASNQGVERTCNWALQEMTCDFVHSHAADDLTLPGFYRAVRPLAEKYRSAGMIVTHPAFLRDVAPGGVGSRVGEKIELGIELNEGWSKPSRVPCFFSPADLEANPRILHPDKFWLATHSALLNRAKCIELGGFPSDLKWSSDWLLIHVLAYRFGFAYDPGAYVALRVSESSYSGAGMSNRSLQEEIIRKIWTRIHEDEYRDIRDQMIEGRVFLGFRGFESLTRDLELPWRTRVPGGSKAHDAALWGAGFGIKVVRKIKHTVGQVFGRTLRLNDWNK